MQFPLSPTPQQRRIRRIPTITLQTMKHIRGNCMRNWVWAQQCGKRGLNTTPVAVGPGFETTRRSATRPTGEEGAGGAGGPGCGARGRWRGLAGLRDDAPSEARGADGERAGRRPRAHKAARPDESGPPAPGTPVGPQATRPGRASQNLRNWAASRPTARSARRAILQSPGRPQCRRRNAPRALPGRPR